MDIPGDAALLYGATPAEFLATRTRLAGAAREAGDRDAARALAGCAKPVLAAWAVNLLVREHADGIGALLAIGARLRAAGDAAELRDATAERRRLVAELVGALTDGGLSSAAQERVAETLTAATADPAAAAAVASGRLLRPLAGGGLDPVDLTDAVAVPDLPPLIAVPDEPAPRPHRPARTRKDADRAAQRALREAAAAVAAAEERLVDRRDESAAARHAVADAEHRLERARSALDAAERAEREAAADASAAHDRQRDAQDSSSSTARASRVAPATAAGIATTATGGRSSSR